MAQRTVKNPPYGYKFNDKVVDDLTELFSITGAEGELQKLSGVLLRGNTSSTDIIMTEGDNIVFKYSGFNNNINTDVLTGNRNINFPDASGTVALTSDITANNELSEILANGNTTGANNISVNNGQVIAFNVGSGGNLNSVSTTAARTWNLPDNNGTFALLSDVTANNELSEILANGNTTSGNNIVMTSGDNIVAGAAAGTQLQLTGNAVLISDDGASITLSDTAVINSSLSLGNGAQGYLESSTGQNLNIGGFSGTVSVGNATYPVVCESSTLQGDGVGSFNIANTQTATSLITLYGGNSGVEITPDNGGFGQGWFAVYNTAGNLSFGGETGFNITNTLAQVEHATKVEIGNSATNTDISAGATGSTIIGNVNGQLEMRNQTLIMSGLPTSSSGLPSGALWNNAGVINIV